MQSKKKHLVVLRSRLQEDPANVNIQMQLQELVGIINDKEACYQLSHLVSVLSWSSMVHVDSPFKSMSQSDKNAHSLLPYLYLHAT